MGVRHSQQWPLAINAYVVGAAMALLAAFDLYKTYFWAVLTNLILAVWIAVSPWVSAFIGDREMAANSVIIGVAVLVLGLWELRSDPELRRQWANSGVMH